MANEEASESCVRTRDDRLDLGIGYLQDAVSIMEGLKK